MTPSKEPLARAIGIDLCPGFSSQYLISKSGSFDVTIKSSNLVPGTLEQQ